MGLLDQVEKKREEIYPGLNLTRLKEAGLLTDELKEAGERIRELVKSIEELQETNQLLTRQSLLYVNKMISILKGSQKSTYDEQGSWIRKGKHIPGSIHIENIVSKGSELVSGIFSTFNTAKRGLYAQQHAVSTASHNIANANTEGYSRQRVHMRTTPGFLIPNTGVVGTGVEIADIARIRDAYLDVQIRYETSRKGQYLARQEILEQVEMAFMEPSDTGLNTVMGRMWDAWQELAKSPKTPMPAP